jgi:hypothetical protein
MTKWIEYFEAATDKMLCVKMKGWDESPCGGDPKGVHLCGVDCTTGRLFTQGPRSPVSTTRATRGPWRW